MARMVKTGRFIWGKGIAENSLSVLDGDLVSHNSEFVEKADATSGLIAGMAAGEQTFESDNQTVDQKNVTFIAANADTRYRMDIDGGTVTSANVKDYFLLTATGDVDGTSVSGDRSVVDTSDAGVAADAVITMQVRLEEFISATEGVFSVVV